jgi:lipopolysaccharide export system permease protein
MQTLRRLIHREMIVTVAFVALAFLALFTFFDLVEELGDVGRGNPASPYRLIHASLYTLLWAPNRLYEILPIAVLIGSIIVMARFAQSSEFTILRTSGMGPWRALRTLLSLGIVFTVLTFMVGDYLAPATTRAAQLFKARFLGQLTVGQTGAWLKEKQQYSHFAVNVGSLADGSTMRGIKIFEFNSRGQLVSTVQAQSGAFTNGGAWLLQGVKRTEFFATGESAAPGAAATAHVQHDTIDSNYRWPTELNAEMVSVALLNPERMSTVDLYQYTQHLQANSQSSQRFEIEFWRKVFYPLSCIVMVVLALPFAYLHFRSSSISGYVFMGVMIGISFFLLNNVFGYAGNLNNWQPWIAAAIPGLLYSLASLAAFGWLVLRR